MPKSSSGVEQHSRQCGITGTIFAFIASVLSGRFIYIIAIAPVLVTVLAACGTSDQEASTASPPATPPAVERTLTATSPLVALYPGEKAKFTWALGADTPALTEGLMVEHDYTNYPQNYYLPDLGSIGTVTGLAADYTAPANILSDTRAALNARADGLSSSSDFFLLTPTQQGFVLSSDDGLRLNHPVGEIFALSPGATQLPNFDSLTPIARSLVKAICTGNLAEAVPFVGLARENVNFALRIKGTINITQAGNHTFRVTSDDGSRMSLRGSEIIANDGAHGYTAVTSSVINLPAGAHAFEIKFFQGTGNKGLCLEMRAPGATTFVSVSPAILLP